MEGFVCLGVGVVATGEEMEDVVLETRAGEPCLVGFERVS